VTGALGFWLPDLRVRTPALEAFFLLGFDGAADSRSDVDRTRGGCTMAAAKRKQLMGATNVRPRENKKERDR
jgi:hypothetical protein